MDNLLQELLGVDSSQAFNFFLTGLRDLTGNKPSDEMLYVASILAHYAQTSRFDNASMPALANLTKVFDTFVVTQIEDSAILEMGGSQIILFAGFFREQMRKRHNVRWYDQLGQSFYDQASHFVRDEKKQILFEKMTDSLPTWNKRCRDLNRMFQEQRFLLKVE